MSTKNKKTLFYIAHIISLLYCIVFVVGLVTIPIAILLYIADGFVYRIYQKDDDDFEMAICKKESFAYVIICVVCTFPFGFVILPAYNNKNTHEGEVSAEEGKSTEKEIVVDENDDKSK